RRTKQSRAHLITRERLGDDGSRFGLIGLDLLNGLVDRRIEALADGLDALEPNPLGDIVEGSEDHLHSFGHGLDALGARSRLVGTREIVDDGEQLPYDRLSPRSKRLLDVFSCALSVIFKICCRA